MIKPRIIFRYPKHLISSIRDMRVNDGLSILLLEELSSVDWFAIRYYKRLSERLRANILKKELTKYNVLRNALKNIKRHHLVYKIAKEELTPLGYWRLKARGNTKAGYRKGFGKKRGY
jgi:hypothetical protein